MESLALIVAVMYLGLIAFGLNALVFAIIYRVKRKFPQFTVGAIVFAAVPTLIAMQVPALGLPSFVCLVAASLLRFLPFRKK